MLVNCLPGLAQIFSFHCLKTWLFHTEVTQLVLKLHPFLWIKPFKPPLPRSFCPKGSLWKDLMGEGSVLLTWPVHMFFRFSLVCGFRYEFSTKSGGQTNPELRQNLSKNYKQPLHLQNSDDLHRMKCSFAKSFMNLYFFFPMLQ